MENLSSSNDEISLHDIINLIRKYYKVIIGTVILLLTVGVLVSLFRTPQFTYRQAISPAYYLNQETTVWLDSPSQMLSMINELWLPDFIAEYNKAHPTNLISKESLQIDVNLGSNSFSSSPSTSNLLYLNIKTDAKNAPIFEALKFFILEHIHAYQSNLIKNISFETKNKIQLLKKSLPKLDHFQAIQNETIKKNQNDFLTLYVLSQDSSLEKNNIEMQLLNLQAKNSSLKETNFIGHTLIIPERSSNILLIILALFLGGLGLGIFLAILLEGRSKLKQ
jgi:hypothetical protein